VKTKKRKTQKMQKTLPRSRVIDLLLLEQEIQALIKKATDRNAKAPKAFNAFEALVRLEKLARNATDVLWISERFP